MQLKFLIYKFILLRLLTNQKLGYHHDKVFPSITLVAIGSSFSSRNELIGDGRAYQ